METAERTTTHAAADAPALSQEPRPFGWTKSQYYQMGEMGWFDNARVELVDGEIITMSPISALHWTAVVLANEALRKVFTKGYLVVVQNSFDGGPRSEPQPDIAVLAGQPRDYVQALPSQAALIVEVSLTTLAYDRTRKAALYAQAGIEDYWIVNLNAGQVEAHRRPGAQPTGAFGYADITIYQSGQAIAPLAMPNAAVAVADLLP